MVGLFFGSFNPIHIGHLAIANYMLSYHELDELWFVISPQNPLKDKKSLLNEKQRLYMVNLAIEDFQRMKASSIEFHLPQPSYTINTMTALEEKYPSKKFSLIMGADNILNFHKWKNFEILLKKYPILVYPRVGVDCRDSNVSKLSSQIIITEAPVIEISSTFIRKAIKDKKNVRFFLPEKVNQYVDEMNFYKK